MIVLFDHYSEVSKSAWNWKNFTPYEIRCRGTGAVLIVPHALDSLQFLRDSLGRSIIVNSAYRSPIYNASVGGAPMSEHKFGTAFDISLDGHSKEVLYRKGLEAGFTGFGLNYNSFIHMDKGRSRTW